MKILLLGDVHGKVEEAKKIVNSVNCDYVLQTGDLDSYSDFSKPIYFIAGNHENWNLLRDIDLCNIEFKNLHHIKTGEIINITKNKEILTLSGINGNYSPKRYEMKKPDRERHFNKKDIEKCKNLKNVDIFLSHEPPLNVGFTKDGKNVGVKQIKEILDKVRPKFFIFCHHHTFFEKTINNTKIIGLGYATREYCVLDTQEGRIERIFLEE